MGAQHMTPERMNAYSAPDGAGGVIVDILALAEDLVMFTKVNGFSLTEVTAKIAEIWAEMEVNVSIPDNQKQ
jgi:hypothetical protein